MDVFTHRLGCSHQGLAHNLTPKEPLGGRYPVIPSSVERGKWERLEGCSELHQPQVKDLRLLGSFVRTRGRPRSPLLNLLHHRIYLLSSGLPNLSADFKQNEQIHSLTARAQEGSSHSSTVPDPGRFQVHSFFPTPNQERGEVRSFRSLLRP